MLVILHAEQAVNLHSLLSCCRAKSPGPSRLHVILEVSGASGGKWPGGVAHVLCLPLALLAFFLALYKDGLRELSLGVLFLCLNI